MQQSYLLTANSDFMINSLLLLSQHVVKRLNMLNKMHLYMSGFQTFFIVTRFEKFAWHATHQCTTHK